MAAEWHVVTAWYHHSKEPALSRRNVESNSCGEKENPMWPGPTVQISGWDAAGGSAIWRMEAVGTRATNTSKHLFLELLMLDLD